MAEVESTPIYSDFHLKTFFETGDIPTEGQFGALIDSKVNKLELDSKVQQINQELADKYSLSVEQINALQQELETMQVGGTNLVDNSSFMFGLDGWTALVDSKLELAPEINGYNSDGLILTELDMRVNKPIGVKSPMFRLTKGKAYTISFVVGSVSNQYALDGCFILFNQVGIIDEDMNIGNIYQYPIYDNTRNVADTSLNTYKVTYTFISPCDTEYGQLQIGFNSSNIVVEESVWIRYVKVEEGNKATSWTLTTKDLLAFIDSKITELPTQNIQTLILDEVDNRLQGYVTSITLTQTVQGLQTTIQTQGKNQDDKIALIETDLEDAKSDIVVAQAQVQEAIGKADTVELLMNDTNQQLVTAQTNIEQNALAISQKAEATYVSELDGKITQVESNLTQTAESLTSQIEEVGLTVQTMEIGGLNLIKYSECVEKLPTLAFNDQNHVNGINPLILDGKLRLMTTTEGVTDNYYGFGHMVTSDGQGLVNNQYYTLSFEMFVPSLMTPPKVRLVSYDGTQWVDSYIEIDNGKRNEWTRVDATFMFNSLSVGKAIRLQIPSAIQGHYIDIRRIQLETGNRLTAWSPSPKDFSQELADNITIVNEQLATANSSITQLSDSIATKVESTDFDTYKTYVGEELVKQTTYVDTKVSEIKQTTDSIILSVQEVETSTNTRIDEVADEIVYKLEILSTNGGMFKNGEIQTTLVAKVYKGRQDVTDQFLDSQFKWEKVNPDGTPDGAWNLAHSGGVKYIVITEDDVQGKATFNCSLNIA